MGSKSGRILSAACIQINAGDDWEKNLCRCLKLAKQALRKKSRLIAFPENFLYRGNPSGFAEIANRAVPFALKVFKAFAKNNRVAVLLGSVLERPQGSKKYFNTSFLISEKGHTAAVYRKIHLFDVRFKNLRVQESRHFRPGRKIVTARAGKLKAGLAICYDLRFPELFRALRDRGAGLFFVPANFTYQTGKDHWEVLLRARAIENQVFVVAPGQTGIHPSTGIRSFGTSLIIDPWGKILAKGSPGREEVITADLDFKLQKRLSYEFPVLRHRRL